MEEEQIFYRISVFTAWSQTQIEAGPCPNLSSSALCFLNFQLIGLGERLSGSLLSLTDRVWGDSRGFVAFES